MAKNPIPVIDLFAGPGGLGEGFSSLLDEEGKDPLFKIALSIEKDKGAHQTLKLRSFFRQFRKEDVPEDYYRFLRKEISLEELYELYPEQHDLADKEAWMVTLGEASNDLVKKRIKKALGRSKKWVLIGGPPCQAYSLVGRNRRGGISGDDPRAYLYKEYLRIIRDHFPPVFVMENVKGLISSKIDGEYVLSHILKDLKDPAGALESKSKGKTYTYRIFSLIKSPGGYSRIDNSPFHFPKEFVIESEKYGIPQRRHRVIFLGIREDIENKPDLLEEQDPVTVKDVIHTMPRLRGGLSRVKDSSGSFIQVLNGLLDATNQSRIRLKAGRELAKYIRKTIEGLIVSDEDRGKEFLKGAVSVDYRPDWYLDERIGGAINHSTRSHMEEDLLRYFYVSAFGKVNGRSAKLKDFPEALLPNHKNVKEGRDFAKFADRFRVQLANAPATTITSHISKDGHYYIHYDSAQCRSLTVREAARIQTFPDNYFFCGGRTSQYHQVGNAVPPLLAFQIAEVVKVLLK